jgi:clan AA aspartic protease (TIGR02281 family)
MQANQPDLTDFASTQKDKLDAAASQVLAATNYTTTTKTESGETTTVYMVTERSVLHVPGILNGVTPVKFIVDSGAAEVSLPREVYQALVKAGTVQKGDALPPGVYILANGTKEKSERFILHSIRIGNTTVTNVAASVSQPKADLLLGQSFLRRFKEWKIDNATKTLILNN